MMALSRPTYPINTEVVSDWLGLTDNAGSIPAFIRFEGREPNPAEEIKVTAPPLPFFMNAKVVEIAAPFADRWCRNLWKDLRKVGLQLAILRLEVVEGMEPAVARSVKMFVRARFTNGVRLETGEDGVSEGDEEKAKTL